MIPVAELRERLITLSYNATQCDQLNAALPPDGMVLSGAEVAQIRKALTVALLHNEGRGRAWMLGDSAGGGT